MGFAPDASRAARRVGIAAGGTQRTRHRYLLSQPRCRSPRTARTPNAQPDRKGAVLLRRKARRRTRALSSVSARCARTAVVRSGLRAAALRTRSLRTGHLGDRADPDQARRIPRSGGRSGHLLGFGHGILRHGISRIAILEANYLKLYEKNSPKLLQCGMHRKLGPRT